tara:strand:- start:848 stop:1681 length:834 start_codon:yes stop_codon:yes gene_type:complete
MISNTSFLEEKSNSFRIKILDTIRKAGKGHIGGAYSCIDILTVLYYANILNITKNNFKDNNRNRFLLSKGHAAIAQYVILQDLGFFDKKELERMNNGGILGEHPDHNIPGIEFDSGSLGHGLSICCGFALSAKLDNLDYKSYAVLGDGECYEGTIWEAALLSSHLNLNNLVAIVDRNGLCIHGETEKINKLNPFSEKWESFGWNVIEVDGHNITKLLETFNTIENNKTNKPTVIIANTIKGKGVSFMENDHKWHHGGISNEIYDLAIKELNGDNSVG